MGNGRGPGGRGREGRIRRFHSATAVTARRAEKAITTYGKSITTLIHWAGDRGGWEIGEDHTGEGGTYIRRRR